MFDLIASVLSFFYDFSGSYGVAILLLTLLIMVLFTPLIFRSTKSMMAMRDIQPEIKKLQAKHQGDRETLNQEMMQLYQRHGVNPVGGCLPLFFQAPVFLVLFRVLRGLTRREVDTGFALGNAMTKQGIAIETDNSDIILDISDPASGACSPRRCFNPEYLDPNAQMAQDLRASNDMTSWGIDLSRSAQEVITDSIPSAIPYLLIVVAIGVLSWYQHHQIQGRSTGAEMNPQMQMVTKIMPWFLPIFSFSMPAALCVYFVGQSVVRVAQQSFITQRFYGEGATGAASDNDDDDADEDSEKAVSSGDGAGTSASGDDSDSDAKSDTSDKADDDADADDDDTGSAAGNGAAAAASGGLMGMLGGGAKASPASTGDRHGARRPVSTTSAPRKRSRPPAQSANGSGSKPKSGSGGSGSSKAGAKTAPAAKNGTDDGGDGLWGRAKRRATELGGSEESAAGTKSNARGNSKRGSASKGVQDTPQRQSKRVTPKGQGGSPGRRR